MCVEGGAILPVQDSAGEEGSWSTAAVGALLDG